MAKVKLKNILFLLCGLFFQGLSSWVLAAGENAVKGELQAAVREALLGPRSNRAAEYLNMADLACIHQLAGPLMQQVTFWEEGLRRALDRCITVEKSSVLQIEILRGQLLNPSRRSVEFESSLSNVRRRYAVAYLFLYDYCPRVAVNACILP